MKNSRGYSRVALLLAVVVVIAVGVIAYAIGRHNNNSSPTTSTVSKVSIKPSGFKYPSGWQEISQIPLTDQQAKVVSEAVRHNPEATIILRVVPGKLAKDFDINKTVDSAVSALRQNLQAFKLDNSSVITVGKHKAISLLYTDSIDKHLQLVIPLADKTDYLTLSAAPADFDKLVSDIASLKTSLSNFVAK